MGLVFVCLHSACDMVLNSSCAGSFLLSMGVCEVVGPMHAYVKGGTGLLPDQILFQRTHTLRAHIVLQAGSCFTPPRPPEARVTRASTSQAMLFLFCGLSVQRPNPRVTFPRFVLYAGTSIYGMAIIRAALPAGSTMFNIQCFSF